LNTVDDPDVVAGLVKGYFREADTPLFPDLVHAQFFETCVPTISYEERIEKFRIIFKGLPQATQSISSQLFQVLWEVSKNSERNMMTEENLSICWAPTLFRSFTPDFITICSFLITYYPYVFGGETYQKPWTPIAAAPASESAPDAADGNRNENSANINETNTNENNANNEDTATANEDQKEVDANNFKPIPSNETDIVVTSPPEEQGEVKEETTKEVQEIGKEKENVPPSKNLKKLTTNPYAASSRLNLRQSMLLAPIQRKSTMANQKYATLTRGAWSDVYLAEAEDDE